MVCSLSFAQVVPDIPVLDGGLNLTYDEEISKEALKKMNEYFDTYAPQVKAFADGLPAAMSDMQTKIYAMLDEAEAKLANLQIAVYFTTESYATVHAAYANNVAGLTLDDVSTKEFQKFLEHKESQLEQAATPSNPLPDNPLPPEIRSELETMNSNDELQATRGKLGNSRISILSAYVLPDLSQVIKKTTVVIATDN